MSAICAMHPMFADHLGKPDHLNADELVGTGGRVFASEAEPPCSLGEGRERRGRRRGGYFVRMQLVVAGGCGGRPSVLRCLAWASEGDSGARYGVGVGVL